MTSYTGTGQPKRTPHGRGPQHPEHIPDGMLLIDVHKPQRDDFGRVGFFALWPEDIRWRGGGLVAGQVFSADDRVRAACWAAEGHWVASWTPEGCYGFYVTVIRNPGPAQRVGVLAGPFYTRDAAQARVDEVRRLAIDADPFTAFDGFGVTRVRMPAGKDLPAGKLNHRLIPVSVRLPAGSSELCADGFRCWHCRTDTGEPVFAYRAGNFHERHPQPA